MKKLILYILILFLTYGNTISFEYSFKSFKQSDKKSLVEFYYKLNSDELNYSIRDNNNQYEEIVEFSLVIEQQGVEVLSDSWTFTHSTKDKDTSISMYDKRVYSLYPGQYNYELEINPKNSEMKVYKRKLHVNNYKDKTHLSNLLISHILREVKSGDNIPESFIKNNYYIVPNISNSVYGDVPFLKLYYEIYNIDKTENNKIKIKHIVRNGINQVVYKNIKEKSINNSDILDIGFVPVDTLKNGTYNLTVEILNSKGDILSLKTEKFYVMDPNREYQLDNIFIEDISFEQSPFSIMNEDRIEIEYDKMRYILSDYEREQFKRLSTLRAKQRAIYKYWKERDPDTTTAVNEFLAEYVERVQYAETYFSKGDIMKGWNSERGRILLKYGFPTQRERFRAKEGKKAAEEWFYSELYGGAYFFFVDKFSDHKFQLVHSTVPGEVKNYNWFDEYNPAIEDDGSPRYKSTRIDANRNR